MPRTPVFGNGLALIAWRLGVFLFFLLLRPIKNQQLSRDDDASNLQRDNLTKNLQRDR